MSQVISTETHVRRHRAVIERAELSRLVAESVAARIKTKPNLSAAGVTYKVAFEEATEGSPAYKVGMKAIVEIEENLSARAEEKQRA